MQNYKKQKVKFLQMNEMTCEDLLKIFNSPKCTKCKNAIKTFDKHLAELISIAQSLHLDFARLECEMVPKERIPVHILSQFIYADGELFRLKEKLGELQSDVEKIQSELPKAVEGEIIVPKQN